MKARIARITGLIGEFYQVGRGFLYLLGLGLIGWLVACSPASASGPASPAQPQAHAIYLDAWAEDKGENGPVALDPMTLADRPDGLAFAPGMFSADGSTGVVMEYSEGRGSRNPEKMWIVVYDLQNGAERTRFHPPLRGLITGLSADGAHLLLQPDLYPTSDYPPRAEWYVLDSTNGEMVAHIKDNDNACFRQLGYLDPSGERIYCVVDPALSEADGPEAMQLVAYAIRRGRIAAELELPEVLIGGSMNWSKDQPVEEFLEPAVALSPDGQRLAIVQADAEQITLVDANSLRVEKTIALDRSANLWQRLGLAPMPAYAKGLAQGTIRQAVFSLDGQYLYVYSQEVRLKPEDVPAERGLWAVDLERGIRVAKALPEYQIQWLQPAPDGTVYAYGKTDKSLWPFEIRATSPSALWRLDGRNLEILAERLFTGYRQGYLVTGPAALATSETGAAAEQPATCPVTRPPATAFRPPKPWPAQPPGADQFWFGEGGLWTALPADGSWRQLALGEKFWWWSQEFDVAQDSTPELRVSARRLDGDSAAFQSSEATNGYHPSFDWAMLVGVELAAPGCWEFTGQYQGQQLSFVLWVPAE